METPLPRLPEITFAKSGFNATLVCSAAKIPFDSPNAVIILRAERFIFLFILYPLFYDQKEQAVYIPSYSF
jgi:hypothetical protein